jgi:aldose 1-epimerase
MADGYEIQTGEIDGHPTTVLASAAQGGLKAAFAHEAGMVGCSLQHRGEELLGQRGGLARYVAERGTMGIPFLHPFANRLSKVKFELAEHTIDLEKASARLHHDPNGLPIHGLLAGASGWVVESDADAERARLDARFDFASQADLIAAFPFPHAVTMELELREATLTNRTTVTATADVPVPISFGYHPYFRLPGLPRAEWSIEAPVPEQVVLDERNLPTGERVPVEIEPGPLGDRTFDDVYSGVEEGARFVLAGGDRRIDVEFVERYPIAVVYAPDNDDVVCFEPMTAPTNALVDGAPELSFVEPGSRYSAAFSVTVSG